MSSEQDFSSDNQPNNIRYPHSGDLPQDQGGERPVDGAPEGPMDPRAEDLTPPDVVPPELEKRIKALISELGAKNESEKLDSAKRSKRNKVMAVVAGAAVIGAGGFGIAKATQGGDEANTPPAPSETPITQITQESTDQSGIDQASSTISIESPSVPTQSSESSESQPLADPNLAPVIVPADQFEKINESNASAILGTLLNNELHAEETGNEDAYRAAFAQQSPDYYGNLEDIVDAGREKSRAFIAALANDPNYPEQSAVVASINSITPSNDGESATVGATVKNENVYPATQENGQLGPKIQKDTTTAAFVLKKANVTNFSNGSSEKIWVIEDIIGYTTVIE